MTMDIHKLHSSPTNPFPLTLAVAGAWAEPDWQGEAQQEVEVRHGDRARVTLGEEGKEELMEGLPTWPHTADMDQLENKGLKKIIMDKLSNVHDMIGEQRVNRTPIPHVTSSSKKENKGLISSTCDK